MEWHKFREKEIIRTIVFIDHTNVFHNLQQLKTRIDWKKFKDYLSINKYLIGALMYMGTHKNLYPKKKRYIRYLESSGYTVISLPIPTTPQGIIRQQGIDVRMFKDIEELGGDNAFDEACLISGDSDFCNVVLKLRELGKSICVWSFKKSMSTRLIRVVGEENVFYIDNTIYDIIKS